MDRWMYCVCFFAYWVICHALLSSADPPPPQSLFFELIRNNFRGSSGLDPDLALHFIGPDLSSNFLHMFSIDEEHRSKMLCKLSGREI